MKPQKTYGSPSGLLRPLEDKDRGKPILTIYDLGDGLLGYSAEELSPGLQVLSLIVAFNDLVLDLKMQVDPELADREIRAEMARSIAANPQRAPEAQMDIEMGRVARQRAVLKAIPR